MNFPRLSTAVLTASLVFTAGIAIPNDARPSPIKTEPQAAPVGAARGTYILGPTDQIAIHTVDLEDNERIVRVTDDGFINLPMIGRVHAGGLTVHQLETELTERFKAYVRDPEVSVEVRDYRSQPVSVIGLVNKPGVLQLEGEKTLVEVLSLAEGLRPEAGHRVKVTRSLEWGRIPLPSAADDPSGKFSVADIDLNTITDAKDLAGNILIRPRDVISIPRAPIVYVVGEVHKPGGFPLSEHERLSVLQALALAEGAQPGGSLQKAKVLRTIPGSSDRKEIPVDIKSMLAGKSRDVPLAANDILFVPKNSGRNVTIKAIEMAVQTASGVVIWRSARY